MRAQTSLVERLRRRDERGLTLPEMLISIVILGLIIGPLSAAMIFFLENGETAHRVFRDDTTSRLAAAYFTADVQSASTIVTTTSGQCGTGTPIATMARTEGSTAFSSSWYSVSGETGQSLLRRQCEGSKVVAESQLGLLASGVPTVTCEPSCDSPGTVTLTVAAADGFSFTIHASPRIR